MYEKRLIQHIRVWDQLFDYWSKIKNNQMLYILTCDWASIYEGDDIKINASICSIKLQEYINKL